MPGREERTDWAVTALQRSVDYVIKSSRRFHFRGKARLLSRVVPRQGGVQAQIFGSAFDLDLSDFIQRQMYLGTYEALEGRLVRAHLRPGMTFVDVGANVGYYTALAAECVTSNGRVISFEPSPYAFERLSLMVSNNSLPQVQAVRAGLSDAAGQLNLYVNLTAGNHAPTLIEHEGASRTIVQVSTLDEEARRLGVEYIDLLKIDVEGYEARVLKGASKLLADRRIRAVLCEFNEYWLRRAGCSSEQLHQSLAAYGFRETSAVASNHNHFFRLA